MLFGLERHVTAEGHLYNLSQAK